MYRIILGILLAVIALLPFSHASAQQSSIIHEYLYVDTREEPGYEGLIVRIQDTYGNVCLVYDNFETVAMDCEFP